MRALIFILFPLCLHAQNYRLDSMRFDSKTYGYIDKYYYQDDDNFERHQTYYDSSGIVYNAITYYEDSLEVKETYHQDGDSSVRYYEYDDLRRRIREAAYDHDSIQQEIRSSYHLATDLISEKEQLSYKKGDTIQYYLEKTEYDSLLRQVYSLYYIERAGTFYRKGESQTHYVDDSLSFTTSLYSQQEGIWDTSYRKEIFLPDQHFGDTLRTWVKYFGLSKDSLIITSDEQVDFQWGNFSKFENAGDWTYLHGVIYGNYIEYVPDGNGFFFTAYESGWPDGSPSNWKEDIDRYDIVSYTGTLTLNETGLPLEQVVFHNNGVINRAKWYYSQLNRISEPFPHTSFPIVCRIIHDLMNDAVYYDISGKRVQWANSSQYLLEVKDQKLERVLYIDN